MGESRRSCQRCGQERSLTKEFFQPDKRYRSGFQTTCKVCAYSDNVERRKLPDVLAGQQKSRHKNHDKIAARQKRWKEENPYRYTVGVLRDGVAQRSRKHNWVIPAELADSAFLAQTLAEEPNCPVCKEAYVIEQRQHGQRHPHSPTIDRFNPDIEGYADNWMILCNRCNRNKGDATAEEHRRIADWMIWASVFR